MFYTSHARTAHSLIHNDNIYVSTAKWLIYFDGEVHVFAVNQTQFQINIINHIETIYDKK